MDYYAGIDVSLDQCSVCMVDGSGQIVCELKVSSDPDALVEFFTALEGTLTRVGLEPSHCRSGCTPGLSKQTFLLS